MLSSSFSWDKVQKTQDASLKVQKEVLASQDAYVDSFKNFSGDLLAGMKALQQATEGGYAASAPVVQLVTQCEVAGRECPFVGATRSQARSTTIAHSTPPQNAVPSLVDSARASHRARVPPAALAC